MILQGETNYDSMRNEANFENAHAAQIALTNQHSGNAIASVGIVNVPRLTLEVIQ